MLAFSDSNEDGRSIADICDWTVRSYETGLSFLPVDTNWDQTGTVDLKMFSQDVLFSVYSLGHGEKLAKQRLQWEDEPTQLNLCILC